MNEPTEQDGFEEQLSRYIVGIDLGTTNCAVAYLDTQNPQLPLRNFLVEQWVDFGTRERRELLPSFVYQPLDEEQTAIAQADSGESQQIVGCLARDRGLQLPGRQVSSAKSWLCHDGVDRRGPILPWQSDEGVDKISPVQASALYLAQIRRAWDAAHRSDPLAEQDIVLTLPASFDQVARQLTIEAAAEAGLPRVLPIEEPQAAFYAWLAKHADSWEQQVRPGQSILVCDIGGGTTDFTLIRVREAHASSASSADEPGETLDESHRAKLSLHRVAVGQHLILGGDNIDLALAKLSEHKLTGGTPLPPRTWDALRQACRVAKETLLAADAPPTHTIHLPGGGSRLIGGGNQVEITAEEVRGCVLDGFFPYCQLRDRPDVQHTGFQEFGLPFARDAAMTRHLAAFLWDHRADGRSDEELATLNDLQAAKPDWVLFNGGVLSGAQLGQRIVDVIRSWFAGQEGLAEDWKPNVLDNERLDLAVAFGAAYFGQVRRGTGVEIEAKLACSYYLQTANDPPQAVCIVPGSASPGEKFSLTDRSMDLAIGQPVQFPIVYSTTRLSDRVGQSVEIDEEHFATLPPIRTVLELRGMRRTESLPVYVEAELSQIGTLQLYCHSSHTDHRWKLEFDVRGSTQTDRVYRDAAVSQSNILDERSERAARTVLADAFAENGATKPSRLMSELTAALELSKSQWPPSLLRAMWAGLMELSSGRLRSPAHEARWLNLLGYTLRPGYGMAADDWRVAQTWRAVHGKLAFSTVSSRNESLILWRRIAGGFTAGQQLTVYQQIAGPLRGVIDPARRSKGGGGTAANELVELLRLVGSLELLPKSEKEAIGDWLLAMLGGKKWAACRTAILWTIGRLGSRVPAYGPLNCVIDADKASQWLERLVAASDQDPSFGLALMLCGRRVDDRYRDVSPEVRELVVNTLSRMNTASHYLQLVEQGGQLESEEATQILGEALPLGLTLK